MKLLVMGDIHSNYIALQRCISLELNNRLDGIILTGDYVSDCAFPQKTMKIIYDLQKQFPVWMIKGNREDYQIMHAHGEFPFWRSNSSTGSLLYTAQNLSENDISFFEKLNNNMKINISDNKSIFVFHGTPDSSQKGMIPGSDETKQYMNIGNRDLMICAHTHKQFVYKYGEKILLNPGSIGLPLESDGRLQYSIVQWDAQGCNIELKSQDYDKSSIIDEFRTSGLESMAPVYSRVIIEEIKTGIDYMPQTLYMAQRLMLEKTGKVNRLDIPEEYWEKAYEKVVMKKGTLGSDREQVPDRVFVPVSAP